MTVRRSCDRRPRGIARAIAAVICALALGAVGAGTSSGALAPAGAPVPAALQALEAKMSQLQVNSERFSEVSRGEVTIANRSNGRVVGRVKRMSVGGQLVGEASLAPQESEIFRGARHTPVAIVIGSTIYTRDGHGRRRWLRRRDPPLARGFATHPFQGAPEEVDAGGTGPFAGLLNLLATATGPAVQGAPAVIEGQPTSEFSATVEPLRLVKGLTDEDVSRLRRHPVEVFLTEAGLPIRVVESIHTEEFDDLSTAQILAVNPPIDVKAPPARETSPAPRHRQRGTLVVEAQIAALVASARVNGSDRAGAGAIADARGQSKE
jgi:hypothetical protein